jgi:hypothetical protein
LQSIILRAEGSFFSAFYFCEYSLKENYLLDDWAHSVRNAFDLSLKLRQKSEVRYPAKAGRGIVVACCVGFWMGPRVALEEK